MSVNDNREVIRGLNKVNEEVMQTMDQSSSDRIDNKTTNEELKQLRDNSSVKRLKTYQEMNKEWKRKSSFDRFGDDLSELILSYLPFEEKFRFECLSKQIQFLIFNKQYVWKYWPKFKYWWQTIDEIQSQKFEKSLKKLKNNNEIIACVDSHLLKTMADNCNQLRRLTISFGEDITEECAEYFGQKCGQKLQYLMIRDPSVELTARLLPFTRELVSLNVSYFDSSFILNSNNEKLLPKLKELAVSYITVEELNELRDNYGNQLTRLTITQKHSSEDLLFIYGLNGFFKLQSLHLRNIVDDLTAEEETRLQQTLDEIAANSPHLRRLSIKTIPKLSFVRSFTQLTELKINSIDSNLSQLKQLTQLKHLTTNNVDNSSDIGQHLPQLESLVIKTRYEFSIIVSDQTILNVSELKKLKSFEFNSYWDDSNSPIKSSTIRRLFDNSKDLRRLVLRNRWFDVRDDIIRETIDLFKSRAERNKKINYYFGANVCERSRFDTITIDLPNNLRVHLFN